MAYGKTNTNDQGILRMQAMLEVSLRLQCEILANIKGQKFEYLIHAALSEVDRETESLIELHSRYEADSKHN